MRNVLKSNSFLIQEGCAKRTLKFLLLTFLYTEKQVRVNGDEGTPVPIPNTVVKLVYGDNTWLATAREDNSSRTSEDHDNWSS